MTATYTRRIIGEVMQNRATGIVNSVTFVIEYDDGQVKQDYTDTVVLLPPSNSPLPYASVTDDVIWGWLAAQGAWQHAKDRLDAIVAGLKKPLTPAYVTAASGAETVTETP